MSCTPQLHLYDHMPENMRTVEATDVSRFAPSVSVSSARSGESDEKRVDLAVGARVAF